MQIGTMLHLKGDCGEAFAQLRALGLSACQLCGWEMDALTQENAQTVRRNAQTHGVTISTFWCGWGGPAVWDAQEGPVTLGIVPLEYREARLRTLHQGALFAHWLGVTQMATHVGFIPESPHDPLYPGLIEALRELAQHCASLGITFLFETGQETPMTLVRTIHDIGTDNVGLNLDPANLIMYGKANPVDALPLIGRYVRDIHAKDGCYPTDGIHLGKEMPLGEGQVNFPALMAGLQALGYDGPVTIEREISGEEQRRDIVRAVSILTALLNRQ